ncbi:hypothetical protein [Rhodoblastus sp.]|uniref:hypothetical protein n=1 Tax=Rhodoblastus sp. TaxID=1962975 RepID=UPI0026083AFE|nr:hypothetical protein [Rhodoblastus sp.]
MKLPCRAALSIFLVSGFSGFAPLGGTTGAAWAQAPETSAAPPTKPQPRRYVMIWRQVGGSWWAGPYATQTASCVHASQLAVCNGQNFKGVYLDGQYTLFWINGCGQPPITIQCEVRAAPAPAK